MHQQMSALEQLSFSFQMSQSQSGKAFQQCAWVAPFCTLGENKLVSQGCVYHLVRVNDSSIEIPLIQLVPIVKEFPEVFPDDLLGVPIEREKDFWHRPHSRYSSNIYFAIQNSTSRVERVVEGLSRKGLYLTKLSQVTVKFQWFEACEKRFQEIKKEIYYFQFSLYRRLIKFLLSIGMHLRLVWVVS